MTRTTTKWRDSHSLSGSPPLSPTSHRERSPRLINRGTQDVFDTIVKGRKSWKTLRGGEVVWPPELEAALLEGLENYQPDDSRETRLLGRFPLRNRFISDYILQKTGKHRTPKQVGSRLQQLRDTCGGKELLNLLSPCRIPGRIPSNQLYHRSSSLPSDSSDGSSSGPSSPTTERDVHSHTPGMSPWNSSGGISTSVICIDILPDSPTSYSSSPVSPNFPAGFDEHNPEEVRVGQSPRPLRRVDPTLTFLSHSAISASSLFNVSFNGQSVHTELVPLALCPPSQTLSSPETDGAFVYSTTLAPNYWQTIVESDDPTKYTIQQEVFRDSAEGSTMMYAATFKFKYANAYPRGHSSSYTTMSGHAPTALDHAFFDGVGVDGLSVSDYHKPPYSFQSFEPGTWDIPQLSPTSDTTSNSSGPSVYRSHGHPSSSGYMSSRDNSISPTSAHFPSNLYHFDS